MLFLTIVPVALLMLALRSVAASWQLLAAVRVQGRGGDCWTAAAAVILTSQPSQSSPAHTSFAQGFEGSRMTLTGLSLTLVAALRRRHHGAAPRCVLMPTRQYTTAVAVYQPTKACVTQRTCAG